MMLVRELMELTPMSTFPSVMPTSARDLLFNPPRHLTEGGFWMADPYDPRGLHPCEPLGGVTHRAVIQPEVVQRVEAPGGFPSGVAVLTFRAFPFLLHPGTPGATIVSVYAVGPQGAVKAALALALFRFPYEPPQRPADGRVGTLPNGVKVRLTDR